MSAHLTCTEVLDKSHRPNFSEMFRFVQMNATIACLFPRQQEVNSLIVFTGSCPRAAENARSEQTTGSHQ